MDLEKAYRKEEQKLILENMVADLTSMKIYPINQPQKTANVIRKERIRGKSLKYIYIINIQLNSCRDSSID